MTTTNETIVVPSGRESSRVKGARILVESRLTFDLGRSAPGRAFAYVRGDDRTYECGFAKGRWWCACPARGKCSHLVALAHVIDVSAWEGGQDDR
jgi:hypothetical protein